MIVEMLLNKNIKILFWSNDFIFSKEINLIFLYYWILLIQLFYLDKMSLKYEISKLMFM
jgi:hypothetical protein